MVGKVSKETKSKFLRYLLSWYRENKRNFPWRYDKDPYKILISEVLLQKTDAAKVLPAYKELIKKYPTATHLENAKISDVRKIIKNLGLLYRAERLISIGKTLSIDYGGKVPSHKKSLLKLRGLGNYTSSAVMCFAFDKCEPIVDNNVVRLFERIFAYRSSKERPRDDDALWVFAGSLLPCKNAKDYNYALLDFSALVCSAKNPKHDVCPLKRICKMYEKSTTKKRKPIGIDLFAGAGGLSLGFEKAGFDIRYAIESDRHAAETYKNNRKNKNLIVDTRDINKISPKEVLKKLDLKEGELDILIGGPPCQGFSTSNMRTRNLANPQNQLVFKYVEFVNALKPKWFLMENVAGLDSFDDGTFRDLLIKEFVNIGYATESIILNAVNFGVPQNRNRIFFIGNCLGNHMEFISKLRTKKLQKPVTVYEAITDLPLITNGNNADEMAYNSRKKRLSRYQKRMRKGMNGRVKNNFSTNHSDLAILRFQNIRQGENLLALAKRRPELVSNYNNVENSHHWIYMRLLWKKPSVTLNNFRKNMLIHPTQDRGLSVREAARLQSFPDKYVFCGSIGFQQQQVSNAVPVILSRVIAESILGEFKI
jgi:DNA (cytosine-5)-methyltransferase 1